MEPETKHVASVSVEIPAANPTPLITEPSLEAFPEEPIITEVPTTDVSKEVVEDSLTQWLPDVQAALEKWNPWKIFRAAVQTGGVYKSDRWPEVMQTEVKSLFDKVIKMPDFQRGVIRNLLEINPTGVTLERIVRVLTNAAGWVAWMGYATKPRN